MVQKKTSSYDIPEILNDLESGMSVEEVKSIMGEPAKDIGSGVHLFVYGFEDSMSALLIFNLGNKLDNVSITFPDGSKESLFVVN